MKKLLNPSTGNSVTVSDEEAERLAQHNLAIYGGGGVLRATEWGMVWLLLTEYQRREERGLDPELAHILRREYQELEFQERVLGMGRPGAWTMMETWRNAHDDREWVLHA